MLSLAESSAHLWAPRPSPAHSGSVLSGDEFVSPTGLRASKGRARADVVTTASPVLSSPGKTWSKNSGRFARLKHRSTQAHTQTPPRLARCPTHLQTREWTKELPGTSFHTGTPGTHSPAPLPPIAYKMSSGPLNVHLTKHVSTQALPTISSQVLASVSFTGGLCSTWVTLTWSHLSPAASSTLRIP